MTEQKMLPFEMTSGIATKECILQKINNLFYLDVLAYGDMWEEAFKTIEEVIKYLNDEWHFTDTKFITDWASSLSS
jgi:hypothetical protein